MNIKYFVLLVIFLICLHLRTAYELLKRRGGLNPQNKIIFAVVFAAMTLMWISWFAMCPIDPLHLVLPQPVRILGFGIQVAGVVLAVVAVVQLRGLENIKRLVTTGVYSKLRHPMYVGFISWIIGWSLYHDAVASFVAGLAGVANILFWQRLEDEKLEEVFGREYLDYRRAAWF